MKYYHYCLTVVSKFLGAKVILFVYVILTIQQKIVQRLQVNKKIILNNTC